MKKLILLFLFFSHTATNAQFKVIATGPLFKEPEDGEAKILQLKSGGTMFFRVTEKDGIDLRVYDPQHHEITATNFKPTYIKVKKAQVNAIFEINGNAILMMSEVDSKIPTLYRLILDGKTGAILSEENIEELNKRKFGDGIATTFGGIATPSFFIKKDPYSDNYAVVRFNSLESDRSKRIEVISYDANNKETNRAFYTSPEGKYKYITYRDMVVLGDKKVCVFAYGYNKSNDSESELLMANLDKGSSEIDFTKLSFPDTLDPFYCTAKFNPSTNSLLLLSIAEEKKKKNDGYIPILTFINPYEKKINRSDIISPSKRIDQYSKKGFRGLPQNLYINDDGTFTVVSEELSVVYGGKYGTAPISLLGDIAIVNYSKTGEPMNDYLIRKSQTLNNVYLGLLYLASREGTTQSLKKGTQFKSFAYLDGKTKSYILFNDTERNSEKLESGNLVDIQGVSNCDGFYYPLTGPNAILKRDYVFGNPEKKRDHELGLFSISQYDRQNNIYVTLQLSKDSGKKGVKLVWLQP
jgi:hypothetical protein